MAITDRKELTEISTRYVNLLTGSHEETAGPPSPEPAAPADVPFQETEGLVEARRDHLEMAELAACLVATEWANRQVGLDDEDQMQRVVTVSTCVYRYRELIASPDEQLNPPTAGMVSIYRARAQIWLHDFLDRVAPGTLPDNQRVLNNLGQATELVLPDSEVLSAFSRRYDALAAKWDATSKPLDLNSLDLPALAEWVVEYLETHEELASTEISLFLADRLGVSPEKYGRRLWTRVERYLSELMAPTSMAGLVVTDYRNTRYFSVPHPTLVGLVIAQDRDRRAAEAPDQ